MTQHAPETAAPMTAVAAADIARVCEAVNAYGRGSDLTDRAELEATARSLARHLPGFDPATSTMPWERDDDFFYEGRELPGWLDAGVDVAYALHGLVRAPAQVGVIGPKYVDLTNCISALITFHPDYDYETGELAP